MPFEVKVDGASELFYKFGRLHEQINGLQNDLPREFMDWQRQDMNRSYPKEETKTLSVSTSIFSRGRRRVGERKKSASKTGARRFVRRRGSSTHRPILRPELFDKLRQRMVAICEAALKWP